MKNAINFFSGIIAAITICILLGSCSSKVRIMADMDVENIALRDNVPYVHYDSLDAGHYGLEIIIPLPWGERVNGSDPGAIVTTGPSPANNECTGKQKRTFTIHVENNFFSFADFKRKITVSESPGTVNFDEIIVIDPDGNEHKTVVHHTQIPDKKKP